MEAAGQRETRCQFHVLLRRRRLARGTSSAARFSVRKEKSARREVYPTALATARSTLLYPQVFKRGARAAPPKSCDVAAKYGDARHANRGSRR